MTNMDFEVQEEVHQMNMYMMQIDGIPLIAPIRKNIMTQSKQQSACI